MKKYLIFASAVACLLVAGCAKDKEKDFADNQVSFSARTGVLETRTDYGTDGIVGGQSVTYVNWVAGDKIKILSSTESSDTYTITEDHDGSDSQGISKANVNPDNSGIAWGTGTQTFYAMYPANVTGSSLTSSAMTCFIPAVWTPADATELGQLPYGYMFAKKSTSRTTSVSLTFNPKFTAFCFTLKNPTGSSVTLSSFSLRSDNKAMNGTYTVNTSTEAITRPTNGDNKSVTVNFPSTWSGGGLVIPAGTTDNPGTKTFTLVTVPDSFSDLTLSCVSGGTTKTMGLKKDGTYLTFAEGKKHNISITLPDFESYTYGFSVMNPTDLTSSASSYPATSNTASVTSWKSSDGGTTKIPVDWTVLGYYSDEQCTTAVSDNWITDFTPSGSGEVKSISINYNRAASTSSAVVSDITTQLQNSTFGAGSCYNSDPTKAIAYNLSNPADMTSDYINESANCYIVNGPGYYKIPLVMGNGVKNGVDNTSAFGVTGYVSFDDTSLKSASNVRLKNHGAVKDNSADIVWTDDGYSNAHVVGNLSNDSDWLYFSVGNDPDAPIVQSNTVIQVTNTSNVVMWSYHIWVTNHTAADDFSVTRKNYNSYAAKTFTIMPYYVGWKTTGGTLKQYASSTIYVKLSQLGSGDTKVMKVYRPSYIYNESYPVGTCTFYQWGRKDPFTNSVSTKNTMNTIAKTITLPEYFEITNSYSSNNYALWSTNYSSSTVRNTKVQKSIYDPCPAGYNVMEVYGFGYSSNLFSFSSTELQFTDGGDHAFYLPFIGNISDQGYFADVGITGTDKLSFWDAFRGGTNAQYYRYKPADSTPWNASSASILYGYPVLPMKSE